MLVLSCRMNGESITHPYMWLGSARAACFVLQDEGYNYSSMYMIRVACFVLQNEGRNNYLSMYPCFRCTDGHGGLFPATSSEYVPWGGRLSWTRKSGCSVLSEPRACSPFLLPEGKPGMSDVSPCLESQGCHLIPLFYHPAPLFFCPLMLLFPSCPFFSLMAHCPNFSSENLFFLFFSLRDRLFCMTVV